MFSAHTRAKRVLNNQKISLRHGGDLDAATALYGSPADGWLDLSTGVSPFAYPFAALAPDVWNRLPSAKRLEDLRNAARRAYDIGQRGRIAPAAGAQALIGILPHIGGGRARVAVVSPTYAEHEPAWSRIGHGVTAVTGLPEPRDFDVVVLANPNNPDGRLFARSDLMALADDLGAAEGVLVVDESFVDAIPHRSLAGEAGHRAIVILRSFGKFFGLAGLRLGFALGPARIVRRIEELLGPWPVSGPALEIGVAALSDTTWIDDQRLKLASTTRRLDQLVKAHGLDLIGGTPLFRLVECEDAGRLHHDLAHHGIWTRPFDEYPRWLRFGVPGSDAAFQRLGEALSNSVQTARSAAQNAAD